MGIYSGGGGDDDVVFGSLVLCEGEIVCFLDINVSSNHIVNCNKWKYEKFKCESGMSDPKRKTEQKHKRRQNENQRKENYKSNATRDFNFEFIFLLFFHSSYTFHPILYLFFFFEGNPHVLHIAYRSMESFSKILLINNFLIIFFQRKWPNLMVFIFLLYFHSFLYHYFQIISLSLFFIFIFALILDWILYLLQLSGIYRKIHSEIRILFCK